MLRIKTRIKRQTICRVPHNSFQQSRTYGPESRSITKRLKNDGSYNEGRVREVFNIAEASSNSVQNRGNERKNIEISSLAVEKDRFLKEKDKRFAYINTNSTKIVQLLVSLFFQGIRRMEKEKHKANAKIHLQ